MTVATITMRRVTKRCDQSCGATAWPLVVLPEVPVQRVGEPDPVALPERIVQMQQVLPGHDRRMGGMRVRPEQRQRIACGADQKEDQDRREEEDDDADEETPNDVGEHARSLDVESETWWEGPTATGRPLPPVQRAVTS